MSSSFENGVKRSNSSSRSLTETPAVDRNNHSFMNILPGFTVNGGSLCSVESCGETTGQDPFGFQGTTVCREAVDRIEHEIDKRRRWTRRRYSCSYPRWLILIIAGTVHVLSASPKVIGWNAEGNRGSILDFDDEEMGTLRAAGMTKSWNKAELIASYIL
jgi:hypothetical protein